MILKSSQNIHPTYQRYKVQPKSSKCPRCNHEIKKGEVDFEVCSCGYFCKNNGFFSFFCHWDDKKRSFIYLRDDVKILWGENHDYND